MKCSLCAKTVVEPKFMGCVCSKCSWWEDGLTIATTISVTGIAICFFVLLISFAYIASKLSIAQDEISKLQAKTLYCKLNYDEEL